MIRTVGLFLFCLASCVTAPSVPDAPHEPTKRERDHATRVTEAAARGVTAVCPADETCIDGYGLLWTPCAWARVGNDEAARAAADAIADHHDPEHAYIVDCQDDASLVSI